MSKRKVFFATPLHGTSVHVEYMKSIMDSSFYLMQHGYDVEWMNRRSSDLATNRNILCSEAIANGSDFLVFCDSDMSFDKEDLLAMLQSGKECIGGAYVQRQFASPALRVNANEARLDDVLSHATVANFELQQGSQPKRGQIVKAKHVGTGNMVIATSLLKTLVEQGKVNRYKAHNIGEAYNFFHFNYDMEGAVGEDYVFCELVRRSGYDVWLYMTDRIRHFGEHGFRLSV